MTRLRHARWILLAAVATLSLASTARAEPSATVLARADDEIAHRKWGAAEEDYRTAIRQGSLGRFQTMNAWLNLGIALSMRGHSGEANNAFMRAAFISRKFELADTTPSRARAAAEAARAAAKKLGRWTVTCNFPESAPRNKPIPLIVQVDLPKGGIAKKLKIAAEQVATNQRWEQVEEAAPTAYRFDVPTSVLGESPLVVVRITLLDKENNVIAEISKVINLTEGEATPTEPPPEVKPPDGETEPPPKPDTEAEPETGGPPPPKHFEVHGTIRTLGGGLLVPGSSVLGGTQISQARLTMKATPSESVTIEGHLLQVLDAATLPSHFNDATTFGPVRYRAFALSNTFASTDRTAATVSIDRLSAKFSFSAFDLTVGRQALTFSKAYFWSPLDVFLPFTPQTIDREYKPGVDAVRIDIPLGEASGITAVAAAGAPMNFSVVQNQVVQPSQPVTFDANSSAAILRAFTNVGGYDIAVHAGSVFGGEYVAAGAAGELATIGLRAEASYFIARSNPVVAFPAPTDDNPDQKFLVQPYVNHARVVFGFERRFESSFYITGEYFFNGAVSGGTDFVSPSVQVAVGETPNISRHLVGGVMSYDIFPTLIARMTGIVGVQPSASAIIIPSLDWSAAENADLQLGALVTAGPRPVPNELGLSTPRSEFGTLPTFFYLQFKLYF